MKADFSMKKYLTLCKPGYVLSNMLTALAGFFLASLGHINIILLFETLLAISFGMASACIVNNYIDRTIDAKMERTKKRPLVTGSISPQTALMLATILGSISVVCFILFTNVLTLLVGGIGFFFYIVLYSITKRTTYFSTLVGTIPGAVVPVAGFTAVTGKIELPAVLLFLLLVFWQLPHFYAISIYRMQEYKNAQIPLLSVVKGIFVTKLHMLFGTICFASISLLLGAFGCVGSLYNYPMFILSLVWILLAVTGFSVKDTNTWAKKMFFYSLLVNLAFCLLIIGDSFLHT